MDYCGNKRAKKAEWFLETNTLAEQCSVPHEFKGRAFLLPNYKKPNKTKQLSSFLVSFRALEFRRAF